MIGQNSVFGGNQQLRLKTELLSRERTKNAAYERRFVGPGQWIRTGIDCFRDAHVCVHDVYGVKQLVRGDDSRANSA